MKHARHLAAFTRAGFRAREVFPHDVVWLAKPYPDAYLNLERRGIARERVLAGRCVQINVYSDHLAGLPDALFTDPAVNWHGQQFGRRGLIAAAGVFVEGDTAYVTLLQSDLCQQVYRSPALKQAAAARLNNRFRYWYLVLFNAVLDFAADQGLETVCSPTADHILGATRKPVAPELFTAIYDAVATRYAARRAGIGDAEYWVVDLAANRDRLVPLAAAPDDARAAASRPVIVICHDIEEDADTEVAPAVCREALGRMLAIERSHGVQTTYSVLGRLFRDTAPRITTHDAGHVLAFHSYDHRADDPEPLRRVRAVDLQVKGYRPPRSILGPETSDWALGYWNFEWLLCSERRLGFAEPQLEHGIVKIPVYLDDWVLQSGELSREAWMRRLTSEIPRRPFIAVGLHDCYAAQWLDWYPDLLGTLQAAGELWTCDQVVNEVRWRTALRSRAANRRELLPLGTARVGRERDVGG